MQSMSIMRECWVKGRPKRFREAYLLSFCCSNSKFSSSQGVLRPWRQQSPSHEIQIRQSERGKGAHRVLVQPAVAHLGKAPQTLDDVEGKLAEGTLAGAAAVDQLFVIGEFAARFGSAVHTV